jgi:hypothetical protein
MPLLKLYGIVFGAGLVVGIVLGGHYAAYVQAQKRSLWEIEYEARRERAFFRTYTSNAELRRQMGILRRQMAIATAHSRKQLGVVNQSKPMYN